MGSEGLWEKRRICTVCCNGKGGKHERDVCGKEERPGRDNRKGEESEGVLEVRVEMMGGKSGGMIGKEGRRCEKKKKKDRNVC